MTARPAGCLFVTLRGRLIISVALVHAVMMAVFVVDLTVRQRDLLLDRQAEQAAALSGALAVAGAGWIAAADVSGLQELVEAQRRHPEVVFAMLADRDGHVLAHLDSAKVGLYLEDLPAEPRPIVFARTPELVDIAVPASIAGHPVGWARVGVNQMVAGKKLDEITRSGVLYALAAILVGALIAWFMGSRLTSRLRAVQATFEAVRSGDRRARAQLPGGDEAAALAADLNVMLDALAEGDAKVRASEQRFQALNQELEQRVATRTALLEAANKELEDFAYSVSHDLRAPLRHIDGYVALLRRKLESRLDDDTRPYMATLLEASGHMGTLIDDLLSYSRIGRQRPAATRVDLAELAREVVEEASASVRARVIRWQVGVLPVVTGDRAMLRVVFVNLVSNALKFTGPRAEAEITLGSLTGPSGETVVFVRDNGVGFDMAYGHKLFGVFERLHAATEFEGTGIGLANVRRIIERHGGRCWAEGHLGQGATFFFTLPAVEAQGLPST